MSMDTCAYITRSAGLALLGSSGLRSNHFIFSKIFKMKKFKKYYKNDIAPTPGQSKVTL